MRASFVAENQSVELDTLLNFDASSSPNNLQQIAQYVWDFDASVDSNNDGDAINDVDAVGVSASTLWTTPGEKTVTLTVSGQLGFDRSKPTSQYWMSPIRLLESQGQVPQQRQFLEDGESNMAKQLPCLVVRVQIITRLQRAPGRSMVHLTANKRRLPSIGRRSGRMMLH